MNEIALNLARKWRSQTFDQIVGQELTIRILKNSLYRGQLFPVYLFSGQRGCGKTTTARVFAAALNCQQLTQFQKNPQHVVLPCLQCQSCVAMSNNKHPDFIEIDAASHTGVDNVRTIIDAASLMPLMGNKKIYLIDEAHMLSKAASNALLKILEEPPRSVVFILATTDAQKIIETVRSRCFTLLFKPLAHKALTQHLAMMCHSEGIAYDEFGLEYIVQETGGSARDAINVLEQVRFANAMVNKNSVLQVMGHVDESRIITLAMHILAKDREKILQLHAEFQKANCVPEFIWMSIVDLLRELLWLKHNLSTNRFEPYQAVLKELAVRYPFHKLLSIMNTLYRNEDLFKKTTAQHAFLEFIFLSLCKKSAKGSSDDGGMAPCTVAASALELIDEEDEYDETDEDEEHEDDEFSAKNSEAKKQSAAVHDIWEQFLKNLEQCQEPLLYSVLKQAAAQVTETTVTIEIPQQMNLFSDVLEQGRAVWYPLLASLYSQRTVTYTFVHKELAAQPAALAITPTEQATSLTHTRKSAPITGKKNIATVKPSHPLNYQSNDPVWKKTTLILSYFPGQLTELGAAYE